MTEMKFRMKSLYLGPNEERLLLNAPVGEDLYRIEGVDSGTNRVSTDIDFSFTGVTCKGGRMYLSFL